MDYEPDVRCGADFVEKRPEIAVAAILISAPKPKQREVRSGSNKRSNDGIEPSHAETDLARVAAMHKVISKPIVPVMRWVNKWGLNLPVARWRHLTSEIGAIRNRRLNVSVLSTQTSELNQ